MLRVYCEGLRRFAFGFASYRPNTELTHFALEDLRVFDLRHFDDYLFLVEQAFYDVLCDTQRQMASRHRSGGRNGLNKARIRSQQIPYG